MSFQDLQGENEKENYFKSVKSEYILGNRTECDFENHNLIYISNKTTRIL